MSDEGAQKRKEWDEATKPGGETTVQRAAKELAGYRPLPDDPTKPDMSQPVYVDRDLPEIGSIMDRPHGRRAKVVSAVVEGDNQVLGLVYVD